MGTNPYQMPAAELEAPETVKVPEAITTKIRNGWIAAAISGAFTLGFVLFAAYSQEVGKPSDLLDAWVLIDVVLVFALAFGIYKRSRFASTFMFTYFLVSKTVLYVEFGATGNILLLILFAYLYYQAMIGTYQYHRYLGNS